MFNAVRCNQCYYYLEWTLFLDLYLIGALLEIFWSVWILGSSDPLWEGAGSCYMLSLTTGITYKEASVSHGLIAVISIH